jgi:osmotically-inducible protein OsmY
MKRILGLGLLFLLIVGFAVSNDAVSDQQVKPDDETITTAIIAKLGADELLSNSTIHVDTDNGFVTLSGIVKIPAEADRATELAQEVDGVRQVSSNLKVESSSEADSTNTELQEGTNQVRGDVAEATQGAGSTVEETAEKAGNAVEETAEKAGNTVKDAGITSEVKLKLAGDDLLSALKIDVDTNNGIVSLTGDVKSKEQADRAVEIAKKVDGVTKVRSKLVVKPS